MMKFAVSSYSLSQLVSKGLKTELELVSVAKELGFDGIEFAEIHTPDGENKTEYAKRLKAECERVGVEPVQYSVGADFIYGQFPLENRASGLVLPHGPAVIKLLEKTFHSTEREETRWQLKIT